MWLVKSEDIFQLFVSGMSKGTKSQNYARAQLFLARSPLPEFRKVAYFKSVVYLQPMD